jgi:hypothetical protein
MRLPLGLGKLPGRFNFFDLFIALVTVTLALLLYRWLAAPYRVAPPYALEQNRIIVAADLQLPPNHNWICDLLSGGAVEVDPRTGSPQAEVTGCVAEGDTTIVSLRLHAVRDAQDRLLFEGSLLVPGRTLQLETAQAILEGVVRRVQPESP